MSDTQWPRYEVFKQDAPGQPHKAVGSVHAPDAEMALLNARDVFARRPSAVSMWVAPASAIFSLTAEELAANPEFWQNTAVAPQPYALFAKRSQRRSMTFVEYAGEVVAESAQLAIKLALADGRFQPQTAIVWWAVPLSAISRSDPQDVASHYAPASDKTYRQQSYYGFVSPTKRSVKREA